MCDITFNLGYGGKVRKTPLPLPLLLLGKITPDSES